VTAERRPDIRYLGPLEGPALRDEMRRCSSLVVPSLYEEICPMVAIEALANGRPVLASARGGLPWLVGAAGWVVEPTVEALARALPTAASPPPYLGALARQSYEERFETKAVTDRLIAVYHQAAAAAR
jgi:glycosyltransferase involved in cell wall biosynthesis